MPKVEPIDIPVNVSGAALRIIALDRAISLTSIVEDSERRAARAVKIAAKFEAYLTGVAQPE